MRFQPKLKAHSTLYTVTSILIFILTVTYASRAAMLVATRTKSDIQLIQRKDFEIN